MTALSRTSAPDVELEDAAGRRVIVAARSPDDRIGELADALGLDPAQPLRLDDRPVGRNETLSRAGLVQGSRLEPDTRSGTAVDGLAVVVGEAGPAAGESIVLGPGMHGLGRAPSATIRIADPSLEPHHGLFDVAGDGTVRFVQLSGRVPARAGGEPVTGWTVLTPGEILLVGASRLRISDCRDSAATRALAALTTTVGDPWRRSLRRTPRHHPRWAPDPIPVPPAVEPPPRPAGAGPLAAVFTMAGAVVVAAVMRSALFLVLGAVGGLASIGVWLGGRVRAGRDRRRATRHGGRDLAAFAAAVAAQRDARWRHHVASVPTVADAVTEAAAVGADVWGRRADHPSAFVAMVGWGPVTWEVALESTGPIATEVAGVVAAAEHFDDVPVPVDLGPGASLAIRGPTARAVVRALIVQVATWTGPADWRLIVVTGDPAGWDWCRWLPHVATVGGTPLVVAADNPGELAAAFAPLEADGRHLVIATDRAELLAVRTGPMRRFLGTQPSVAVIAAVPADDPVPALCVSALEVGSTGTARWRPDTSSPAAPGRVHVAGVTTETARRVARRLAGLHDPEDPATADNSVPTMVTLRSVNEHHGSGPIDDAIAIAACWRSGGPDPPPVAAIGLTGDGGVEVDLARDGPHALIAGTTGSGKSELLRTLVTALAARSGPDHVTFVLIDYKGGATFDACTDLPHTAGVVTDLDERLADRALVSLEAELRRRERLLRAAGAQDLSAYRAVAGRAPLPRLVVVIDEFAALAGELPQFLASLVGIAQRGRSLGLHLVLATQRPAGVVDDHIRANTNLRIALRLQDPADGRDVVGDPAPASFPRGTPGRAMLRLGPGETVVFQAATGSGHDLDVLVRSIRHAAALSDVGPLHRPWLPPLPPMIGADGCHDVALGPGDAGVLDDPAEQAQRALRWEPERGHLALLGGRRSGTTTAVRTLLATLARERSPAQLHAYVIDASGDDRLDDLERLASCGAVVRPHERERLGRLLRRLVAEIDARRQAGGRGNRPHVVLAIDGLPQLGGALASATGELELLTRIIAEGAALGVTCAVAATRPGAIPVSTLAACGERWVFRLDDPAEAPLCGVPAGAVRAAVPGRVVVASSGLEAQLAVIDVEPGPLDALGGGPRLVGTLPAEVAAADIPPGSRHPDGETQLVIGIDFESLEPATLTVPDGEHVLVAGPPRSGRSTTLMRLAESWCDAHPAGVTHAVAPLLRSPLAARPDAVNWDDVAAVIGAVREGDPCLLLIDDAERVDDPSGAVGALIADRRPGLLVIAAGRPDALRIQYGQWTNVIRRSRAGLLMSACADTDGDVLGELLPRRPPIPSRPGLAWVVSGGQRALVQVARSRSASPPRSCGP